EGEVEAARVLRGPSILVNCEPKLPFPRVYPDDLGGSTELTRHLLELGHRRMVFMDISRPGADFDHFSRTVRQNAMREEMTKAGCGDGYIFWHSDFDANFPEIVARYKGMPASQRPTAIVVSYSIEALSLLSEFVRQGVKVP